MDAGIIYPCVTTVGSVQTNDNVTYSKTDVAEATPEELKAQKRPAEDGEVDAKKKKTSNGDHAAEDGGDEGEEEGEDEEDLEGEEDEEDLEGEEGEDEGDEGEDEDEGEGEDEEGEEEEGE